MHLKFGINELKIELNSSALELVEVVVTADGEDPAYGILRNVIKNKPKNSVNQIRSWHASLSTLREIKTRGSKICVKKVKIRSSHEKLIKPMRVHRCT